LKKKSQDHYSLPNCYAFLQLQEELSTLQNNVVNKLREQNKELTDRLQTRVTFQGRFLEKLRNGKSHHEREILRLRQGLEASIAESSHGNEATKQQLRQLCDLYDDIITGSLDEDSDEEFDANDTGIGLDGRRSLSPARKSRSKLFDKRSLMERSKKEVESYYLEMMTSLEASNKALRLDVEKLQKEMHEKEKQHFHETMARLESTNNEQVEKLKNQVGDLSHELANINLDNRALREKLLRTESENEILNRQIKDMSLSDSELASLQTNLDTQLSLNQHLEIRMKELNLIRQEHTTICESIKAELAEAKKKLQAHDSEKDHLSLRLRDSRELQGRFDEMNTTLNEKLEELQEENSELIEELSQAKAALSKLTSQKSSLKEMTPEELLHEKSKLQESLKVRIAENKSLEAKLQVSEKQRSNANTKAKALRDRLKTMQESWDLISKDAEKSYASLKEQYQQQVTEYKSIIASLKSQNAGLNAQLESVQKVKAVSNEAVLELENKVCIAP